MSNILVISTSLRPRSNSDILTERLVAGARDAGHQVEEISLKGKELKYCIGCLACQKTQRCVQKDDALWIADKMKDADTLVFSTPIYYYEMSGQMKTLLDRMNPLYSSGCICSPLRRRTRPTPPKRPSAVWKAGWTALKRRSCAAHCS